MSKLVVGLLSSGEFVAATTGSPYFCTVADDEETLHEKVQAASDFYRQAREAVPRGPTAPRVGYAVQRIIPHRVEEWAPWRTQDEECEVAHA